MNPVDTMSHHHHFSAMPLDQQTMDASYNVRYKEAIFPSNSGRIKVGSSYNDGLMTVRKDQLPAPLATTHYGLQSTAHMLPTPTMTSSPMPHSAGMASRLPPLNVQRRGSISYATQPYMVSPRRRDSVQMPPLHYQPSFSSAASGSTSPTDATGSVADAEDKLQVARKRSRHAWPADMTRQIINVLLDEFLNDPSYRTTIYRSREERDHRFVYSGRSILEEYNKVQNIRRRYFIPLSYLLQWDQLRLATDDRSRQRVNIEKKLAKPLERGRLQMIFCTSMKPVSSSSSLSVALGSDELSDQESEAAMNNNGKPVFELDIFVTELKQRDPELWARGHAAFQAWISRKCSIDFILN
ncbi:hypothetical protein J3B02_001068 [Coemansia erecta]|uniref:Uncharacterized protein n=1 Tax=Coemansia asiatica TaxID=1052880 RepID=A0A9W7XGU2_9FUNG|nr:hypothetical protein LPJ64_005004 [Coemansia asiatica]KAJ2857349.1 hypothetical protein J3B02_001068 [Coemansia erecta]KAJ2866359.1 hypothetical protein FB639_005028 [Coemansia asiatica]